MPLETLKKRFSLSVQSKMTVETRQVPAYE
jgi:hypothetical protein